MRISVLSENAAARSRNQDCLAEWGLSLYLELDDLRILFDSGHKGTFISNARVLGVDLDKTDLVVLSHHHWDHTGGLRFHEFKDKKNLVAHPIALEKMPAEQSENIAKDFNVSSSRVSLEVSPNVYFLGEIPRVTSFEKGVNRDDPMTDDSALAINTPEGVLVITGCSHAGIVNICEYAKQITGQPLYGAIGGFHLFEGDDDAINGAINYFKQEKAKIIHPMHCVDHAAMTAFYQNFKVKKYGAGDIFEVKTSPAT